MPSRSLTFAALVLLLGCSDEAATEVPPAATIPATPCSPGEKPLGDASCQPAGIPDGTPAAGVDECGPGFAADGEQGCEPILPAMPCGPGEVAALGETSCHPVAPCGTAPWGDIPIDNSTQFVDQTYTGNDSDGSEGKPWTTVQAGVDAAAAGGIVAVAAGSYGEALVLSAPVRLWGRCPDLVEVVADPQSATITVTGNDIEVHSLAIRGTQTGLTVLGGNEVLLEQLWVHDTGADAINIRPFPSRPSVTVRDSLLESAYFDGLGVASGDVVAQRISVRDTRTDLPYAGSGIVVTGASDAPATLSLQSSIIERNRDVGVHVEGAELDVEASLIRDTRVPDGGNYGHGLYLGSTETTTSHARIEQSVFVGNQVYGVVLAGSVALMNRVVVRDTMADTGGYWGIGVGVDPGLLDEPGELTVNRSLVDGNRTVGISIVGSELTMDATLIRDTVPEEATALYGHALDVVHDRFAPLASSAVVTNSVLEHSHHAGVLAAGSTASLTATTVRDTRALRDGRFGTGVWAVPEARARSSLTLDSCVVEDNYSAGAWSSDSDLVIESSVIRDTKPLQSGALGRGIGSQPAASLGGASVELRWSVVEGSHDIGICIVDGDAVIEGTRVSSTADIDGAFGDGVSVLASTASASVSMTASLVNANSRAGASAFGAALRLSNNTFDCNPLHLVGEDWYDKPYELVDGGGNVCGCDGQVDTCKLSTRGLSAPEPVEPDP